MLRRTPAKDDQLFQEKLFPATMMLDQDWWHTLWPDPDGVVKALHVKLGMMVVDLGCGNGYFTAASPGKQEQDV